MNTQEDLTPEEYAAEMAYNDAHRMQFNSTEEMFAYMDSIEEYEDINDFDNPEEILQAIEDSEKEFSDYVIISE